MAQAALAQTKPRAIRGRIGLRWVILLIRDSLGRPFRPTRSRTLVRRSIRVRALGPSTIRHRPMCSRGQSRPRSGSRWTKRSGYEKTALRPAVARLSISYCGFLEVASQELQDQGDERDFNRVDGQGHGDLRTGQFDLRQLVRLSWLLLPTNRSFCMRNAAEGQTDGIDSQKSALTRPSGPSGAILAIRNTSEISDRAARVRTVPRECVPACPDLSTPVGIRRRSLVGQPDPTQRRKR